MPLYSCDQVYSKELYNECMWCAYYKLRSYKKIVLALIGVVLAAALIFVFLGKYVGAAIIALSMPIYPIILRNTINKQIDKAWESNTAYKNLNYHVDFYDTYYESVSKNGTNKIYYDKLFGILESEHALALMSGNNQGSMLAKNQMSEELIAFLKTKAKVIE